MSNSENIGFLEAIKYGNPPIDVEDTSSQLKRLYNTVRQIKYLDILIRTK